MDSQLYQAVCALNHNIKQMDLQDRTVETSLKSIPIRNETPIPMVRKHQKCIEIWVCNVGDKDLMIGPSTKDISADLFSVIIAPKDTLIINATNYNLLFKKGFDGLWDSSASFESVAMITEFRLK